MLVHEPMVEPAEQHEVVQIGPASADRIAVIDHDVRRGDRLRTMNPDGTDLRTIYRAAPYFDQAGIPANGGELLSDPAWSPDRRWIAVTRLRVVHQDHPRKVTARIVLVRADGREIVPLMIGAHPTWSPDGSAIAFARGRRTSPGRVVLADSDGSNERVIARFESPVASVRWSPAGGQILVVSGDAVWSMGEDGSEPHQIVSGATSPSFSPAGTQIYSIGMVTSDGGECGPMATPVLQRSAADGTGLTILAVPGARDGVTQVDVAPDGASLALMVRRYLGSEGCDDFYDPAMGTVDTALVGQFDRLRGGDDPSWSG
jgi:WD40 repeat protein